MVKAVVLGAAGGIGQVTKTLCYRNAYEQSLISSTQPLSLLCKISPLIDELALFDVVNTPGVAADLSHISSVAV